MADKKITVTVRPNSNISRIDFDPTTGIYKASVKESPDKGKANRELLKLIRKSFGSKGVIVRGARSRLKIIKLT